MVDIINGGPAVANDSVLTVDFKAQKTEFIVVDLFSSEGPCALDDRHRGFTCRLGGIQPGPGAQVRLLMKPVSVRGEGRLTINAQVASAGMDLNRRNNGATSTVTVLPDSPR